MTISNIHSYIHAYIHIGLHTHTHTLFVKQSWSKHIDNITSKANSVHALLQRNLRQCLHQIKSLAYRTYVRPILEYASAVWSPYTKADKYKLEMSQRKAARFVYNDYSSYSSVTNMLQQLNWESLEHRRIKATIIMFYKIINNIVSVNFSQHLQHLTTRTRGHHLKFLSISARVNSYHHSFLPRAIRLWNSLPTNVVTRPNLRHFCNELDMHLHSF